MEIEWKRDRGGEGGREKGDRVEERQRGRRRKREGR
jgi:hypothetical protein